MIPYLELYFTFIQIGLFTIGGGLAALPLLHDELVLDGHISQSEFVDMIAVSQSTPGPIGINMATYIGFNELGIAGAVIATAGMVTPSIVIIILIARFMQNIAHSKELKGALAGLRPCAVGLIAAATWFILSQSILERPSLPLDSGIHYPATILFLGLCLMRWRLPKAYPVLFILVGAIAGILLY